jgi:DNA-binding HxlR family transcriptional regulator
MPKLADFDDAMLHRVGAREILNELARLGPRRYSDLFKLSVDREKVFETTTTLANRLRELAILGLIEKKIENNVGERVKCWYQITDAGRDILQLMREMGKVLSESKVDTNIEARTPVKECL